MGTRDRGSPDVDGRMRPETWGMVRSRLAEGNATCTNGQVVVSLDVVRSRRSAGATPYDRAVIEDVDDIRWPTSSCPSRLGGVGHRSRRPPRVGEAVKRAGWCRASCTTSARTSVGATPTGRDERDAAGPRGAGGGRRRATTGCTTWSAHGRESTADEHRLLGRVMRAASPWRSSLPEYLAGEFAGEDEPVLPLARCAGARSRAAVDLVDVWSSLGVAVPPVVGADRRRRRSRPSSSPTSPPPAER